MKICSTKVAIRKFLCLLLIAWLGLSGTIVIALAQTEWSDTGSLCEGKVTYKSTGKLEITSTSKNNLSDKNATAVVESKESGLIKNENQQIQGGYFSLEMSTTTSTYYTVDDCKVDEYEAGKITLTITISNNADLPIRLTNVTGTDDYHQGDIINAGASVILKSINSPDSAKDTTPHTITETVCFEFEYLGDATLSLDSSQYAPYNVTTSLGNSLNIS